jgi:hypothetical protein
MGESSEPWPKGLRIEIYGASGKCGHAVPSRAHTEPVTLLVWFHACEVLRGTPVELFYYGMDSDSARCAQLGIRSAPTVRLLFGEREIGRIERGFLFREDFAKWMSETVARDNFTGVAAQE